MISHRIDEPSVETPWNNQYLYLMNYYSTSPPSVPYGDKIMTNRKENQTYWILVNWEQKWMDQHKDYRPSGDHAKLLDDLYLCYGVAFPIVFHKKEGEWSHEVVGEPTGYKYEMWDGDQRYMETISLEKLDCTQEEIDDVMQVFENAMKSKNSE